MVALATGDYWLGLVAGGIAGMLVSLVMVLFCVRLGLDQIVVGIAIVLSAEGATSVLHDIWYSATFPRLPQAPAFEIPVLSDIPVLGGSLFTPAARRCIWVSCVVRRRVGAPAHRGGAWSCVPRASGRTRWTRRA